MWRLASGIQRLPAELTQVALPPVASPAAELEDAGWHVDEMTYETRAPVAPGEVMKSVVEHLIGPGSVSRLV
jgi:hypothetical protein